MKKEPENRLGNRDMKKSSFVVDLYNQLCTTSLARLAGSNKPTQLNRTPKPVVSACSLTEAAAIMRKNAAESNTDTHTYNYMCTLRPGHQILIIGSLSSRSISLPSPEYPMRSRLSSIIRPYSSRRRYMYTFEGCQRPEILMSYILTYLDILPPQHLVSPFSSLECKPLGFQIMLGYKRLACSSLFPLANANKVCKHGV